MEAATAKAGDFSVSYDNMKGLLQEDLKRLQAEISHKTVDLSKVQLELDKRREEMDKLDKQIAAGKEKVANLTDATANGLKDLEANKAKVMKAMADREDKANEVIEAGAAAQTKAATDQSKANSRYGAAVAAKQDILVAIGKIAKAVEGIKVETEKSLESIV